MKVSRGAALVIAASVLVSALSNITPGIVRASPPPPINVAVRGTDGALWVDAGGVWQSYGGLLFGAPAWASYGGTTFYVATGADHALWVRGNGGSQGWQHLGAGSEDCLDTPAVSVQASTLTVACAGSDYALWYAQAQLSVGMVPQVAGWTSLGGYLSAGPASAVVEGQTTFAVTGKDGAVYFHTTATTDVYAATSWSCIGHPSLADYGGRAYFACHGNDGAAWYAQDGGAGWGEPQSAGGRLLGGASLSAAAGGAYLYAEGTDHSVYADYIPANGAATGYAGTGGSVEQGGVGGADTVIVPVVTAFPAGDTFNLPACGVPANSLPVHGKVIIISLACQVMTAYQDGRIVVTSYTTTGRPARPTPRGSFSVVKKNHPWQMISGDPPGSPYWYPPSWVQYVVWFTWQGHGIHDASWEPNAAMGPGSEYNNTIASHGCVHINSNVAANLYDFADLGTPVLVY